MKKMLAMLLAMLLLAAPLSGLAEAGDYMTAALEAGRRVNWSISLSEVATDMVGEPAVDQVITELLSAVVIRGYMQDDETYYAISMKQDSGAVADLLTVGTAISGNDAYILSNIIGGAIVVSADEVVPVLERLTDMFVMLGFITEQQAATFKAELSELWPMMKAEFAAAMSASALDDLDVTSLNLDALMNIANNVAGNMVQSEPDPLPRNCDPAVSMVTCIMTPEEMKALLAAGLQFIKDNPELANAIATEIDFDNTIAPELSGVAGEPVDFMGFIDMAMAELAEEEVYNGDVVMRIWMDEAGEIVALETNIQKDGEVLTDSVQMSYHRMTMNSTVAHSGVMTFPEGDISLDVVVGEKTVMANFAVAEAGENRVLVQVDYTDRSEGSLQACDVKVDMTVTEADVNMNAYYYVGDVHESVNSTVEDTTIHLHLDYSSDVLFSGVDFTASESVTIAVNGKEYLTVLTLAESTEPGASITEGNVVRPAKLSDADFANWFVQAYTAMFSWLQNAVYALPASVMNLLNTGF